VYPSSGSGINRPCVVAARDVTLSGAAVVPATDCVKPASVDDRRAERLTCGQMQANKAGQALENPCRVRMAG
jgi:hypothetical protein